MVLFIFDISTPFYYFRQFKLKLVAILILQFWSKYIILGLEIAIYLHPETMSLFDQRSTMEFLAEELNDDPKYDVLLAFRHCCKIVIIQDGTQSCEYKRSSPFYRL